MAKLKTTEVTSTVIDIKTAQSFADLRKLLVKGKQAPLTKLVRNLEAAIQEAQSAHSDSLTEFVNDFRDYDDPTECLDQDTEDLVEAYEGLTGVIDALKALTKKCDERNVALDLKIILGIVSGREVVATEVSAAASTNDGGKKKNPNAAVVVNDPNIVLEQGAPRAAAPSATKEASAPSAPPASAFTSADLSRSHVTGGAPTYIAGGASSASGRDSTLPEGYVAGIHPSVAGVQTAHTGGATAPAVKKATIVQVCAVDDLCGYDDFVEVSTEVPITSSPAVNKALLVYKDQVSPARFTRFVQQHLEQVVRYAEDFTRDYNRRNEHSLPSNVTEKIRQLVQSQLEEFANTKCSLQSIYSTSGNKYLKSLSKEDLLNYIANPGELDVAIKDAEAAAKKGAKALREASASLAIVLKGLQAHINTIHAFKAKTVEPWIEQQFSQLKRDWEEQLSPSAVEEKAYSLLDADRFEGVEEDVSRSEVKQVAANVIPALLKSLRERPTFEARFLGLEVDSDAEISAGSASDDDDELLAAFGGGAAESAARQSLLAMCTDHAAPAALKRKLEAIAKGRELDTAQHEAVKEAVLVVAKEQSLLLKDLVDALHVIRDRAPEVLGQRETLALLRDVASYDQKKLANLGDEHSDLVTAIVAVQTGVTRHTLDSNYRNAFEAARVATVDVVRQSLYVSVFVDAAKAKAKDVLKRDEEAHGKSFEDAVRRFANGHVATLSNLSVKDQEALASKVVKALKKDGVDKEAAQEVAGAIVKAAMSDVQERQTALRNISRTSVEQFKADVDTVRRYGAEHFGSIGTRTFLRRHTTPRLYGEMRENLDSSTAPFFAAADRLMNLWAAAAMDPALSDKAQSVDAYVKAEKQVFGLSEELTTAIDGAVAISTKVAATRFSGNEKYIQGRNKVLAALIESGASTYIVDMLSKGQKVDLDKVTAQAGLAEIALHDRAVISNGMKDAVVNAYVAIIGEQLARSQSVVKRAGNLHALLTSVGVPEDVVSSLVKREFPVLELPSEHVTTEVVSALRDFQGEGGNLGPVVDAVQSEHQKNIKKVAAGKSSYPWLEKFASAHPEVKAESLDAIVSGVRDYVSLKIGALSKDYPGRFTKDHGGKQIADESLRDAVRPHIEKGFDRKVRALNIQGDQDSVRQFVEDAMVQCWVECCAEKQGKKTGVLARLTKGEEKKAELSDDAKAFYAQYRIDRDDVLAEAAAEREEAVAVTQSASAGRTQGSGSARSRANARLDAQLDAITDSDSIQMRILRGIYNVKTSSGRNAYELFSKLAADTDQALLTRALEHYVQKASAESIFRMSNRIESDSSMFIKNTRMNLKYAFWNAVADRSMNEDRAIGKFDYNSGFYQFLMGDDEDELAATRLIQVAFLEFTSDASKEEIARADRRIRSLAFERGALVDTKVLRDYISNREQMLKDGSPAAEALDRLRLDLQGPDCTPSGLQILEAPNTTKWVDRTAVSTNEIGR